MKKLELATIIASRKIVRNFIWFYKLKNPPDRENPGDFLDGL
nr:MAG TPA: DNA-binding domain protein [Caudoviricetes sp.]